MKFAENAPIAMLVIDIDHLILHANHAAETTFGILRSELHGHRLDVLIPGTEAWRLDETGSVRGRESRARRSDGTEVLVEVWLTPVPENALTLVSIVDISERRRGGDQFRVLAESLPQMVWTCEGDGPCDYLSPQWVAYTGIPEAEQLGYRWLEQLHPDDLERVQGEWAAVAARQGILDTEFRIRRFDGVYRWFKTRGVPLRDTLGTVTKWVGSNTDIQDFVDAREATLRTNRELEARVEARTAELAASNRLLSTVASQLQTAQRITRVGSWELDVASGRVKWSDELFRVMRIPCGEAPPYHAQRELFAPESWERLTAAVSRSVASGEGYELTLQVTAADGTRVTALSRAEALRDDAGNVVELVGTFQDITERELVTAELRHLNERLQLATSAGHTGVWDWDIANDTLVWDDTMHELYGITRDQFSDAYLAWSTALHPEDRVAAERAFADGIAGIAPFDTRFRIVRGDGEIRHIRAAAKVHRDPTGAAARMIGVSWDVTAQTLAQEALMRSEAVQRAVVEHAGTAIIATDTAGLITLFNRSAEELLGYAADDVVHKLTPGVIHDPGEVAARRAVLERELGLEIASPFEVFVIRARLHGPDANEWTYVRKDGSRVPVLLTVTAIRAAEGTVTGYLGVAIDLTQRKRAEQELVELNHLLADRSAQREVLLQEVHHRVKNNLQVIASLVSMQIRQLDDAAAKTALKEMQTRVRAIALIHEQLYQAENYANVLFSDYAKNLARSVFHSGSTSSAVCLELNFEEVRLAVDKAIPCGLILNELIVNAFKHAFPDGRAGTISVSLAITPAQQVVLTVADDGCGIRVERERTQESLGMRLVQTLTRQLSGTLEVHSAPAMGATVQICFPIREITA